MKKQSPRRAVWMVVGYSIGLTICSAGCSGWPSNQLRQCRDESNRALGRYQLEAQRAERLEVQNRALTERVSDLEKRLAMIYEASEPGRGLATSVPPVSRIPSGVPANLAPMPTPNIIDPPQSAWRSAPKRNF